MKDNFFIHTQYCRYTLEFKFDAGTSRGVLKTKTNYFIKIESPHFPGAAGYGEAGPLAGLSEDDIGNFAEVIEHYISKLSYVNFPMEEQGIIEKVTESIDSRYPSLRFAFETALLDLLHGGKRKIFPNDFYDKHKPIPINGLIWMGDRDFMLEQIREKLTAGYECIKMKIGALDFEQECELLGMIREKYPPEKIILRVDANGAFHKKEALKNIIKLNQYGIHSIEQPISRGSWKEMGQLCKDSPIDIALDEELIGIHGLEKRKLLLKTIQPKYIILKPTLLGGIGACREWVALAEELGIGWWMTSALESNVGLNAISQFTATYHPEMPQGLGTGLLYRNNIASPLAISSGKLCYDPLKKWSLHSLSFGSQEEWDK